MAETNPLKIMLEQVDDLEIGSTELRKDGFDVSKILQIMDFALQQTDNQGKGDGDNLLDGLDMTPRQDLIKKSNAVVQFEVKNAKGETGIWHADMRKTGRILNGKPQGKPDVSIQVADKDLLNLMMGQGSPQKMFLTGKLKVKGNLMLGLRMNDVLAGEVKKLQAKL